MPLFLMFLAIPLLEIAAFIVIGGKIGIGPTLAAVVLTALAGSMLLRRQGLAVLARIRADMEARRMPGKALAEGAMIAAAGLLLLTPGFVTDAAGFALFLPPVRMFLWQWIGRRIEVGFVGDPAADRGRGPGRPGSRRRPDADPGVIDLDADDYSARPDPDSPWRDGKDR